MNRTDNSDLAVKDVDKTNTQHAEMTEEKTVDRNDDDGDDEDDDEDYDTVNEYVHKTHSVGDVWKSVSTPKHHDVGPVLGLLEKSTALGAKPKEEITTKKPEESVSQTDSTELKVAESKDETEDTDRDEGATNKEIADKTHIQVVKFWKKKRRMRQMTLKIMIKMRMKQLRKKQLKLRKVQQPEDG